MYGTINQLIKLFICNQSKQFIFYSCYYSSFSACIFICQASQIPIHWDWITASSRSRYFFLTRWLFKYTISIIRAYDQILSASPFSRSVVFTHWLSWTASYGEIPACLLSSNWIEKAFSKIHQCWELCEFYFIRNWNGIFEILSDNPGCPVKRYSQLHCSQENCLFW